MSACEKVIEDIVGALLGETATVQENYYGRELLRNLVRMARCEYAAEIRSTIMMMQDENHADPASREKSKRLAKKIISDIRSKQTKLNFGR